jgi:hypothetical protein
MGKRVVMLVLQNMGNRNIFKNGLYVHLYRSLHRRSDFSEDITVKKGVELQQDLVATETFNNFQKLSNMRRLTA